MRGFDGDVAMGAMVEREGYGILFVGGGAVGGQVCHRDKCACIGRVGHHAYHYVRHVGGGGGAHPEAQLQVGDGV